MFTASLGPDSTSTADMSLSTLEVQVLVHLSSLLEFGYV